MSWLLVALIPGLLMLATFGLGRLEACLDGDVVSPADVDAFVERARADCAKPAARGVDDETYPLGDSEYREYVHFASTQALPTRMLIHQAAIPELRPTRHAYRV